MNFSASSKVHPNDEDLSIGTPKSRTLTQNAIKCNVALLPHHDAALHHKADVLDGGDVVEGVAGDGDDVGEVAGLELADLALPASTRAPSIMSACRTASGFMP